jgi:ankyrin repeat protein
MDLPSVVSKNAIKELRRSLVNIPDIEGRTPLVIASKNGNHGLIADLLEMGADIMRLGPEGLSALSVAATLPVKNSLDKSLVDQLTSSFGESVNHNVRSSYNSKEKSILFDKFVPQIASLKDKNWAYGKGPVGYAALNGLRSSVAQLLASGDFIIYFLMNNLIIRSIFFYNGMWSIS